MEEFSSLVKGVSYYDKIIIPNVTKRQIKLAIKKYKINISHFIIPIKRKNQPPISIQDVINNQIILQSNALKKILLKNKLIEHKCHSCNLQDWKNKPITLELSRIDGDKTNNNLNNIRLLCCTCHKMNQYSRSDSN